jgi:hypothetical protein
MIKNVSNENHPEHTMFQLEVIKIKAMREMYNNLQIFTNF